MISRFADIAMVRTGPHEKLTEFAKHGSIPVINGLTAFSHPCQILADLMTFEEHKGRLNGQRIAWLGDGNNVLVSFIHAAALFDFELAIACPPDFMPPQAVLDEALAQWRPYCGLCDPRGGGHRCRMCGYRLLGVDEPMIRQRRKNARRPLPPIR